MIFNRLKIFFMQNIYLEILLIIFIFSKKMYCNPLCQRCCGEKEYIRMEKVFGDAIENGAADVAIDNLKDDISGIQDIFGSDEILSDLKQYFTTKKNSLPKRSRNFTDNRKRLNVANDCFIIHEVIGILKTCYKNYNSFLEANGNENLNFTVNNFNNCFKMFLELCELMIKESLENYRLVEGNEDIKQILLNLQQNDTLKINNINVENVEKKEYEVDDTTELRNKIGYLFNIFFGELIKYRLRKDFNNEVLGINDDNENFGITDEEIKNIDGLSL